MRTDWKQSGIDRRDERNTKVDDSDNKVRKHKKRKQKKPFAIEARFTGEISTRGWTPFFKDGDWHNYFSKYATLEDAKKGLATKRNSYWNNDMEFRIIDKSIKGQKKVIEEDDDI